ncbi:MAG: SlyX family protein [Rhodospirillaceae bacterium]
MTDPDDRLTELETRIAHYEQALADLSDTTRDQWTEIDALRREVTRLRDRVAELERGQPAGAPADEKPPHY